MICLYCFLFYCRTVHWSFEFWKYLFKGAFLWKNPGFDFQFQITHIFLPKKERILKWIFCHGNSVNIVHDEHKIPGGIYFILKAGVLAEIISAHKSLKKITWRSCSSLAWCIMWQKNASEAKNSAKKCHLYKLHSWKFQRGTAFVGMHRLF